MSVGLSDVNIQASDFLGWALKAMESKSERFDAVIGNPPFIRYQYLPPLFQDRAQAIFAKRTRDATQSRRLLALRSTMVAAGMRRIGGVGLQIIRTGCCASTPADRTGSMEVTGRTLEAQRRSPPRTSFPAVDGVALAAQGPGAVALGDVRHLARRDHGRARVEGALRQDLGGPRHYAQNELAVEAFKKNLPNWRRSGQAPERRRDRAVVAR